MAIPTRQRVHRGDIKPNTLRTICATAGWDDPPEP